MFTGFHFGPNVPFFTINMRDVPVLLALMAVAAAAEGFLSQKKDWRLGLALPGGILVWNAIVCVVRAVRYNPRLEELFIAVAVESIPALILLVVYVLSRFFGKRRLVRQMDKTRIHDL